MNRLLLFLAFLTLHTACAHQTESPQVEAPAPLVLGAYQFDTYLPLLEGKRVGMLVNHTSMVGETHLVDTLQSLGVNILKVFAPEHGFRGTADAGEAVEDGIDKATGLPLISLYGSNKKPSSAQMGDLDVVIFDIQDVGARFYTYISTMHYMMEACAEEGKKMLVLDRPNPNGMYVDGPILEPEFRSFVGMHPIPVVHGLTVGELAEMINGEGWLNNGIKCDLTVVGMDGYTHDTVYELPVKPSPNLPNQLSIQLYPSLCLFEATVVSVGRGTYEPFQQIGHPLFTDMQDTFTPVSIDGMSKYPRYENEEVFGLKFDENNAVRGFDLGYLIEFYQKYGEGDAFFTSNFFEKLAGTASLRNQLNQGKSEEEIRATWQDGLNNYKSMRENYLLYP